MTWILTAIVVAGFAYFSSRFAWWRKAVADSHPRILMYHMVSEHRPGARFNKLRVPPSEFERQLDWLNLHEYRFVFMSELAQTSQNKTVALTFDDGYRDNLERADKLLAQYGAKATLYLVADRHDRDWSSAKKAHHDSGELKAEPKLTDDQVRELLSSGRWELAAHTVTHAHLPSLPHSDRQQEIADGKKILEESFGVTIDSFAYPFGHYDPIDVEIVRAAGFRTACTTNEGISTHVSSELLELPRIKVSGKDGQYAFTRRMRTGLRGWR